MITKTLLRFHIMITEILPQNLYILQSVLNNMGQLSNQCKELKKYALASQKVKYGIK